MKSFCSFFFLLIAFSSFAQQLIIEDSIASPKTQEVKRHSVKKAVLYSSLVPGWGQVYNKKWWKVPIIYAGFGGLGVAIGINTKQWRTYSDAYRERVFKRQKELGWIPKFDLAKGLEETISILRMFD